MIDFDLLIFDMDGVLADTTRCHSRAFDDLWRLVGVIGPPYERIAGCKTADVVAEVTRDFNPAVAQINEWVRFKQVRARHYINVEEIAFPDTVDCLADLISRGYRLALGTSASRETAELVLNRLGVADTFSTIVTGEQVPSGKPAPDVYIKVLEQAETPPWRALIIEDSQSGLSAAIASQAYAAVVRSGHHIESERFIGSFADLWALIDILGGERA